MSYTLIYDHTGLVAENRDPGGAFLLDMLGGTVYAYQREPAVAAGFRGIQISMAGPMLEVIEPTRPNSFLYPYLAKRGAGWHHLTFYVDGINEYVETLQAKGIPLTGVEWDTPDLIGNAFIRPSASHGILFQFRPKDKPDRQKDAEFYQGLPAPRPLRGHIGATAFAVLDGEAAAAFFQDVLGGTLGHTFRRADADVRTLHIGGTVIEIMSPAAPDGPLNQRLASDGPGIWYVTMELTQFDAVMQFLASRGLTTTPGEDPQTVYLTGDNPTAGIFRFVNRAHAGD